MSLFSFGTASGRCGLLFDIGSGSVMVAVVHTPDDATQPHILWSHREHIPLRENATLDESAKAVMSALMNSVLTINTTALPQLAAYNSSLRISMLQVAVAAPWSFTVSKNITYQQPEPFTITDGLLDELTERAQARIVTELEANDAARALGLEIVARTTIDTISNGYRVAHPTGERASTLELTHACVVVQRYLVDALTEVRDKVVPNAELELYSFMLMLYCVTKDTLPYASEACLIDLTYEATEIGLVREGVLRYCTHAPIGTYSLARSLAQATKKPVGELFGLLKSESLRVFNQALSDAQQRAAEPMFEAYINDTTKLFHETGDTLAIPKRLILHTEPVFEPLFSELISRAAKRATRSPHLITTLSSELRATAPSATPDTAHRSDDALSVNARFFHDHQTCGRVE